jgi:aryl-alcohol dehydrogenase-like predicted oxidoreductase
LFLAPKHHPAKWPSHGPLRNAAVTFAIVGVCSAQQVNGIAGAADVKLSANDMLEIDQGLTSRAACERIERASDTAQKPDVSP